MLFEMDYPVMLKNVERDRHRSWLELSFISQNPIYET